MVQFQQCPLEFQKKFRKVYQQLKIVDSVGEVKGIFYVNKKFYKLIIDNSRIALSVEGDEVKIGLFLFNEFYRNS